MSGSGKKKKKRDTPGVSEDKPGLEAPAPPPPSSTPITTPTSTMDEATLSRLLDGFADRLGDKLAEASSTDRARRDAEISRITSSIKGSSGSESGHQSTRSRDTVNTVLKSQGDALDWIKENGFDPDH